MYLHLTIYTHQNKNVSQTAHSYQLHTALFSSLLLKPYSPSIKRSLEIETISLIKILIQTSDNLTVSSHGSRKYIHLFCFESTSV